MPSKALPRQILLGVGGLLLSILIILTGFSGFARENTTVPLTGNYLFNNGWLHSATADGLFKQKSFGPSEAAARKALAKNLADTRAIRILALSKEAQGDDVAAQGWLDAGGRLSWRDSATQVKLFEYAVKRGDFTAAVDHADSLLRRRVAPDQFVGIFLIAAQDEKLSATIAAKLAANPSWRPTFFGYKQNKSDEIQTSFERVVDRLAKTQAPVSRDELATYAGALVTAGQPARALRTWNRLFPSDGAILATGKSINPQWPDGNRFQKPLPVDWRFVDNRKAVPIISTDDSGRKSTLELEMEDDAIGIIATRTILLPAGLLSLQLPDAGQNSGLLDAITWSLSCSDGSAREEMQRQGDKPLWTITVPSGCNAHHLNLELRNSNGGSKIVPLGRVILTSPA